MAQTYADSFTINGLTKIATGKRWERILWLIVLSIALSIVGHQLSQFISEYRKYDVLTKVHVVEGGVQRRPDIVVCAHDYLTNNTADCRNGKRFFWSTPCLNAPSLSVKQTHGENAVLEKFIDYPKQCVRIKNVTESPTGIPPSILITDIRLANTTAMSTIHVFALDENSTTLSIENSITSLKPGVYSISFFSHKVYTRLEAPYRSNCTNGENIDMVFPGGYTQSKCVNNYLFRKMLANCGTVFERWLPFMKPQYQKRNNTNMTNNEINTCINNNRFCEDINGNFIECTFPCPKPCHEESFKIKEMHIFTRNEKKHLMLNSPESRTTYINEIPAYTMEKLLSEIGGYLGLFVGMSILSLIEIMVYIGTVIKERYYGI